MADHCFSSSDQGAACRFRVSIFWWLLIALSKRVFPQEREFFIDNLLVRIHFIIVMIRWTGLTPWEFEFPKR